MANAAFILATAAALWLVACTTGPSQPVVASPPSPDKARLYVYRDATIYDSQMWTAVSLNRAKLGDAAPGTVFYRDVAPGTYEVEVRSDRLYPDQFKTVTLAPGSITFAKVQEVLGWGASGMGAKGTTFVVSIADPTIGTAEIRRLRLVDG